MVLRFLGNTSQHKFLGLERDIVLNRLTSAEIRSRYLRDLSGPDMAQWLDDAFVTLDQKEEHLNREQESAQGEVNEIASINAEYQLERRGRVKSVADKLKKALDDCLPQYKILTFQTGFFVDGYTTQEEKDALVKKFAVLDARAGEFEKKAEAALNLLDSLSKLAE